MQSQIMKIYTQCFYIINFQSLPPFLKLVYDWINLIFVLQSYQITQFSFCLWCKGNRNISNSEMTCIHIAINVYGEYDTESLIIPSHRAFDVHKHSMLSYKDILLGLSAMEPCTQHGGTAAEMRSEFNPLSVSKEII